MDGNKALEAIHNVIKGINNQDEKIWRSVASKKYLKKEIEKLNEQTKFYEVQINTLKSNARITEGATQLIEDAINQQIQIFQLLSLHINTKNSEIYRRKRDIKSWDEKYAEAISDLKEAFEERRAFYESSNNTYKELRQSESAQTFSMVELKNVQAKLKAKERSLEQLREIKRKILHATVINITKAILRQRKSDELNAKMRVAEEKKKEIVQVMFEAREALKKQNLKDTRESSNSITSIFSKMLQNKDNVKKDDAVRRTKTTGLSDGAEKENTPIQAQAVKVNVSVISPTKVVKKDEPTTQPKKINIIANKRIDLPPLKSILSGGRSRLNTSNRSFAETSFNQSQTIQQSSQKNYSQKSHKLSQESNSELKTPLDKKPSTTSQVIQSASQKSDKLSQDLNCEQVTHLNKKQTSFQAIQKKLKMMNNLSSTPQGVTSTSDVMASEYFKNLKLSTQPIPQNEVQTPKKTNAISQGSQKNQKSDSFRENRNQLNNSVFKTPGLKRKSSNGNLDMDALVPQAKKIVNFASPIEKRCDESPHPAAQNNVLNMPFPMNESSNMNINSFIEEEMGIPADSVEGITSPEFSLIFNNTQENASNNRGTNINKNNKPMFQEYSGAGSSFGFSFGGGMPKTLDTWGDLFE